MRRFVVSVLFLVSACNKGPSQSSEQPTATASAAVATASQSAAAASAEPRGAWYVGTWKGEFAATRRPSATTPKEGAPAGWEKDDGKKLSGPCNIEIAVDANGIVSGSINGALGDLALRGTVDGEELRANLVAKSNDPTSIHNGTLMLTHEAGALKGRLNAASGDALAMRQAELSLKKAAQ